MTLLESPQIIRGVTSALIGVATEVVPTGELAVLFVPAPRGTRTGAHRLHVRLARELALAGIPSLRYDAADGGDCPPAAAPAARHDGDIVAAASQLLTIHPRASIALVAFGHAALPLVRALPAVQAAKLPCTTLCLIDPALERVRPIEARGWWRRLTGQPSRSMAALGQAVPGVATEESTWLALPAALDAVGCGLRIVAGDGAHLRELMHGLVHEDRDWRRVLAKGTHLRIVEGADAAWSHPEQWRTIVEWLLQQLTSQTAQRG